MLSLNAMAYDFSYTYQGKTLYYNITSDNTVEVTCYSNFINYNNYVSGDVVIPSSVTNNGTTYSVTSIGDDAFYYCSGLTSVTIPNSVTSIGNYAFYYCSGLTSVTFPNSVTSIGNSAFYNCSGLTSVTIPNSVTSIGDRAFYECSSLTSVTIPNSVTSIGNDAFAGCSGLTSITIPNSVTFIGNYAFYGCNGLTSIVSNAVVPPVLGGEVFSYSNNYCNTTVPCGSLVAYIASSWNDYFPNRITEVLSFDLSVAANDDSSGSVSVETQSCNVRTLTATPSSCKSFVAWNDGNTDNPRTVTITSDTSFTAIFESVEISNDITAAICQGSAYTENGFNVSEAGVYTQNLQTINGCDSTVTLTLTVNPVATTTLQAAICEGTAYTENGFNVSEAGVYTQNLQTINGCDSVVTLTLTVNPVATTTLQAAICEGTTYTENGFNVSAAGVYTQNLQTINGCDSIVTLTLTVNPVYSFTIDATINQGETYHGNGFEVSEAGTYTQNLQTVNGCDSVIVLNLTVNSSLGDVVANTIEVALYPNPAENYTVLKVQGLKEQTKVALFDVRGRKLREFDLSAGTESVRLDLQDLPSGVYTLMIGNTTKKLIVE